ncbi:NADH-quinone oxidoreductase subunit G [Rhodococcus coprophilus]|uniref:NADH-quinone oxidoreductase n=1 Tax=Rhodococcus coprophilus TaxID=38310 RepID=A0A2X4U0B4_9NOCA|nr:NADH-quinone oxidoreductase subunit G [Rhodococcus coprophilus]MBM7460650.1 NADH-quinone oxidoreductase subunit G [Rhodococcus coprophilus]SQI28458.1 NADH dehydrogenase subunit G [Rhodococcus coprophilus]
MTTAPGTDPAGAAPTDDQVTVTIDDIEIRVAKGTLVIRAAELVGVQIPRFCDHPLLDPVGACRQCLVDVEGQRKPLASCTTVVTDGMVVRTQATSPVADKAQRGVMELLLINHPLDCPVCDKGGECPLQNQALSNGRAESRYVEEKRTFPKPIAISSQVLLDRERCVLCARCTRFSAQIAGDPLVDMLERGARQQVGIYPEEPFESYFSGNTVQICPVGALTGATYRFRARPFDLVSSPSVCEHCASGCAQRTDHRRGVVLRRLAGDDPEVNEEWNCDKGRWAFTYATEPDRLTGPLVRDDSGELVPASWPMALAVAARGLTAARGSAGVLAGGRLTREDAYAYAKFARVSLATNDIDFRARDHSAEETQFLTTRVAARGIGVTYRDLERAPVVLLVGFEPEEESPIVFLRLHKAVRSGKTAVWTMAPYAGAGATKLGARLLECVPGREAELLDALREGDPSGIDALRRAGAVIVVGERLAGAPGGLTAATRLADATGARLAWIPRRAGERGALDAGAFPTLLPGGRSVTDADARREVAAAWNLDSGDALPEAPGRDTATILEAAAAGNLGALVVAGVELADLPDPDAARAALAAAPFVVSLEVRRSEVTDLADVVFPVAPVAEKSGTFVDWEGRPRPFAAALRDSDAMPDRRVLHAIADAMDVDLGASETDSARTELKRLGEWPVPAAPLPDVAATDRRRPVLGEAVLATWRMLLDAGRLQDGEPNLAGTARAPVVRLSASTAAEIGARGGEPVTVFTDRGEITLPLVVDALPERVVWLPTASRGAGVHEHLAVTAGAVVGIRAAQPETEVPQ